MRTGTIRRVLGEACVIEGESGKRMAFLVEDDVAEQLAKVGYVEGRKVKFHEDVYGIVTAIELLAD